MTTDKLKHRFLKVTLNTAYQTWHYGSIKTFSILEVK